jgi:hypothetical protein
LSPSAPSLLSLSLSRISNVFGREFAFRGCNASALRNLVSEIQVWICSGWSASGATALQRCIRYEFLLWQVRHICGNGEHVKLFE